LTLSVVCKKQNAILCRLIQNQAVFTRL